MARFNQKRIVKERAANTSKRMNTRQGGVGYSYKTFMHLLSILTTKKYDGRTYYLTESQEIRMLNDAVDESVKVYGAEFTAKLIVYVRAKDGHRTGTHIAAVRLMKSLSGEQCARLFFSKRHRKKEMGGVIFRVDDMMEIASYYYITRAKAKGRDINTLDAFKGINLPNSMLKGFRKGLESADWYELAKYQNKGKMVSLVDLINLTRPVPNKSRAWASIKIEDYETDMRKAITKKNENAIYEKIRKANLRVKDGYVRVDAFQAAIYGWLRQMDTVEDKNTKLGQTVAKKVKEGKITKSQAQVELVKGKSANFRTLIESRKIGYFALLRNLKNIHDAASSTMDKVLLEKACALLIDEKLIKSPSNLVFPHQVEQARDMMMQIGDAASRRIVVHLDKAYDIACANLEDLGFFGRSAVVIDSSASMRNPRHCANTYNKKTPLEIGALIGATLAKGVNADLYEFASATGAIAYDPSNSVSSIAQTFVRTARLSRFSHGTNMGSIFQCKSSYRDAHQIKPVERVFIISDMQNGVAGAAYIMYKRWMEENNLSGVYVYLINVNSYGTSCMPDNNDPNIIHSTGYSYETLKQLIAMEANPNALYDTVNEIKLEPFGSW